MIAGSQFYFAVQSIEKGAALGREKRKQSKRAFLQRVVRKQRTGDFVFVTIDDAGAKSLRAARFCAQPLILIEHFFGSSLEGSQQGLVQLGERIAQSADQRLNRFFTFVKPRREGLGQGFRFEARAQLGGAREEFPAPPNYIS